MCMHECMFSILQGRCCCMAVFFVRTLRIWHLCDCCSFVFIYNSASLQAPAFRSNEKSTSGNSADHCQPPSPSVPTTVCFAIASLIIASFLFQDCQFYPQSSAPSSAPTSALLQSSLISTIPTSKSQSQAHLHQ